LKYLGKMKKRKVFTFMSDESIFRTQEKWRMQQKESLGEKWTKEKPIQTYQYDWNGEIIKFAK
jgi:hypothetical protein